MDNFNEIPGLYYYINAAQTDVTYDTGDEVATVTSTVAPLGDATELTNSVFSRLDPAANPKGSITHNPTTIRLGTEMPTFRCDGAGAQAFQVDAADPTRPNGYEGPLTMVCLLSFADNDPGQYVFNSENTNSQNGYFASGCNSTTDDHNFLAQSSSRTTSISVVPNTPVVTVVTWNRSLDGIVELYIDKSKAPETLSKPGEGVVHSLKQIFLFGSKTGSPLIGDVSIFAMYTTYFSQEQVNDVTDLCNTWLTTGAGPAQPSYPKTDVFEARVNDPNATMTWLAAPLPPDNETPPVYVPYANRLSNASDVQTTEDGQGVSRLTINTTKIDETGMVACQATIDYMAEPILTETTLTVVESTEQPPTGPEIPENAWDGISGGVINPARFTHVGSFVGSAIQGNTSDLDEQCVGQRRRFGLSRTKDSIFVRSKEGADKTPSIAEFSIPAVLAPPGTPADQITGSYRMTLKKSWRPIANPKGLTGITPQPPTLENADPTHGDPEHSGGILHLDDGRLIVEGLRYYPTNTPNPTGALILLEDGDDIETSTVRGTFLLSESTRYTGYFTRIPPEWRSSFGNREYAMGSGGLVASRTGRQSIGPSFAPLHVGAKGDSTGITKESADAGNWNVNIVTAMVYPGEPADSRYPWGVYDRPTGLRADAYNALKESAVWSIMTWCAGAVMIPGTNTLFCVGRHAGYNGGRIAYKNHFLDSCAYIDDPAWGTPGPGIAPDMDIRHRQSAADAAQACSQYSQCFGDDPEFMDIGGFWTTGTDLDNYYWCFDIAEIVKGYNGEIEPHSIRPYDHGVLNLPYSPYEGTRPPHEDWAGMAFIGGVDYDADNDLLYIALDNADSDNNNDYRPPLYVVYNLLNGVA